MAKQQVNIRLSSEGESASLALQTVWGYGGRTDAAEAALICWEWALAHASERVARQFSRGEWNLIADICNGTMWAYGHTGSRPGMLLAAEVEDGHRLDGVGYRWLSDSDLPDAVERKKCDEVVRGLIRRLAALEYVEAWAVIRAVCWFWQHNDIDFQVNEWWTPAYRRERSRNLKESG